MQQFKLEKATTRSDFVVLTDILKQYPALMHRLDFLKGLNSAAYLAAGVIRNLVWSHLHQQRYSLDGTEIDVIFFDAADKLNLEQQRLTNFLNDKFPQNNWDVVNQALVHQWYQTDQGKSIDALHSIEHGMSLWPETATAIAMRLLANTELDIVAPLGLSDLMGLKLRYNPALVSRATFDARLESKQFLQRWPDLALL